MIAWARIQGDRNDHRYLCCEHKYKLTNQRFTESATGDDQVTSDDLQSSGVCSLVAPRVIQSFSYTQVTVERVAERTHNLTT